MADGSMLGMARQALAHLANIATGGATLKTTGSAAVGNRVIAGNAKVLPANTETSLITGTTSAAGAVLGITAADGWPAGKSYRIVALSIAIPHDTYLTFGVKIRASGATSSMLAINALLKTGLGATAMAVPALRLHGHPLFEMLRDEPQLDTANGVGAYGPGNYIFGLRPGITLDMPNGGDITVRNLDPNNPYTVSYQILVIEVIP